MFTMGNAVLAVLFSTIGMGVIVAADKPNIAVGPLDQGRQRTVTRGHVYVNLHGIRASRETRENIKRINAEAQAIQAVKEAERRRKAEDRKRLYAQARAYIARRMREEQEKKAASILADLQKK